MALIARRASADRPRSTHACTARCGLGCGAGQLATRSPQLYGRGLTARPPHQVGGCGFALSAITRSIPAAPGPRTHRPVENRPTVRVARARALRGADLVVLWDNARSDPPQFDGRGAAARPPHQVSGRGFRTSVVLCSTPAARGPRAHRPVDIRPTAHGTRARALNGADLVVVRDNSRRAPLQLVGRGSVAWSLHQVGGYGFGLSVILR